MNIGIIGLGNIGYALLTGLSETIFEKSLIAYDHNNDTMSRAKKDFQNIRFSGTIQNIFETSEVVLVCIRTNQLQYFLDVYSQFFIENKIFVFLSAGIRIHFIRTLLNKSDTLLLRAITNINIASKNGYTILLKNENSKQYAIVYELFKSLGEVLEVQTEKELETFALLPGCSPAIVGLLIHYLEQIGIKLRMNETLYKKAIFDAILGTVANIQQTEIKPLDLAKSVATPNGMVEKALTKIMEDGAFENALTDFFGEITNPS